MARNEVTVVVDRPGRDLGKTFIIREMPAFVGEAWATRLLLHLAHSGMEIPTEVLGAGMAGLAVFGLKSLAGLKWEDARPLLDEMMTCVHIVPDPAKPTYTRPVTGQDDIEEILTIVNLRDKWFELHTGFSVAARFSGWMEPPADL